jgi:hypothetical protein
MKTATRQRSDERLSVPWNIAEWVDNQTVRAWVEEEIATLDWKNPELLAFLRENPNLRARVLLTVLGYAYCTGVYDSEEVSGLCATEPTLRAICGDQLPSARILDRFRRENRGILKWVLVQILKRGLRTRYNLNTSLLPAGLRQYLVELATERLDLERHIDRPGQGA